MFFSLFGSLAVWLLLRTSSFIISSLLTDLFHFSSRQCKSFKTRADEVKDGMEKGVPGIKVLLNPDKVYLIKDINVFHGFELMWME